MRLKCRYASERSLIVSGKFTKFAIFKNDTITKCLPAEHIIYETIVYYTHVQSLSLFFIADSALANNTIIHYTRG